MDIDCPLVYSTLKSYVYADVLDRINWSLSALNFIILYILKILSCEYRYLTYPDNLWLKDWLLEIQTSMN